MFTLKILDDTFKYVYFGGVIIFACLGFFRRFVSLVHNRSLGTPTLNIFGSINRKLLNVLTTQSPQSKEGSPFNCRVMLIWPIAIPFFIIFSNISKHLQSHELSAIKGINVIIQKRSF